MPFTGGFSSGFSSGFAVAAAGGTNYPATGSGGVTVGGTAPVSFVRAFAAVGSGGVHVAGSAPANGVQSYTAVGSGGVSVAGTATPARGRVVVGSGGVVVGGTAPASVASHYEAVGSGGVVVGGTAPVSTFIQIRYTVVGTREYTGTGVVGDRDGELPEVGEVEERAGAAGTIVPRAGGAMGTKKPKPVVGGGRNVVQHFIFRGSGLVRVRGGADYELVAPGGALPPVPRFYVGAGGVGVGGSAAVGVNISQHYQGFSHGGVTISGSAPASRNNIPLPLAYSVFGSGGPRVGGTAAVASTSAQHYGRVGAGGVRVGGTAPAISSLKKSLVYSGSGIVIVRGSANVTRFINTPGGSTGAFVTPVAPATFDTTRNPAHFTSEVVVTSMADLQAKLNTVPAGTRLRIPLGVDWSGSITLKNRGFGTNQWIEIAPDLNHSVIEANTPYGRRMNLGKAAALNLPTLRTPGGNGSIVYTEKAAQGYRLTALNFRTGGSATAMVRMGNTDAINASEIGKRIIADRCTAIGGTTFTVNRAFYLCGEQMAVLGCWTQDIYGSADSQSILILGWAGPYVIKWNRLEGWSENVMFGGGEITAGGVPSDATIEENYFTKNIAYRFANPFGNSVKNLIEFKSIVRVRCVRNIFEYMWKDGQPFPANFKSVNQSKTQPQQGTRDVEFAYNWLRDVSGGFNLSDNPEGQATPMRRVYIHDNLLERINLPGSNYAGNGIMLQLNGGLSDVTLDHNTWVKGYVGGVSAIAMEGAAIGPIALRSNIIQTGGYALKRTNSSVGKASWEDFVPDPANRIWQQNVAVGTQNQYKSAMPVGTIIRDTDDLVGYADLAGGDYTVTGALATAGHDGLPVGIVDVPAFKAALLNVPNG